MTARLFPAGSREFFSFERDFLPSACRRCRVQAFETDGWFIDIGVPDDFDRAQVELLERVPFVPSRTSTEGGGAEGG
jgi:NDP-sugar pyrophosphorylase family protein